MSQRLEEKKASLEQRLDEAQEKANTAQQELQEAALAGRSAAQEAGQSQQAASREVAALACQLKAAESSAENLKRRCEHLEKDLAEARQEASCGKETLGKEALAAQQTAQEAEQALAQHKYHAARMASQVGILRTFCTRTRNAGPPYRSAQAGCPSSKDNGSMLIRPGYR